MYSKLLLDNQNKRLDVPMWQLICFAMFCTWQMGIIYYVGPSLSIDGRTPLPISADNMTLLIVSGYIASILIMIFLPKWIITLSRISTIVALVSAVGLFFPAGNTLLTVLIYIQCFCCCFMIGFESATMVHYFTPASVVKHLLIAYPVCYTGVAFIQNDFIKLDFSIFRILMVCMLICLSVFYFKMPTKGSIDFVQKKDGLILPKQFLIGLIVLAFLSALLGVIAPAAATEIEHGVFVAYLGCAIGSLILLFFHKKTGRHPICFVPYVIVLSAIGYILLIVTEYVPGVGLIACVLIGIGMAACAMLPMFSLLFVKQYPSKFIVPIVIGLAMLAVIVQSVIVELFRSSTMLLNLTYLVIIIILAFVYMLVEPYLLYSTRRKFVEPSIEKAPAMSEAKEAAEKTKAASDMEHTAQAVSAAPIVTPQAVPQDSVLSVLTKRELEIVELISYGYSNADIAKMLFISVHTAKDHTKNIYRKLEIHSRFELTALVNRNKGTGN